VNAQVVVHATDLSKSYGAVAALRGLTLELRSREVLAVVGDNGAGKSTLVKLLAGAQRPSGGQLLLRGEEVEFRSAHEARERGIETVYQNLALADNLPVWANMFLGREIRRPGVLGALGGMSRRTMRARARDELAQLHVAIADVDSPAGDLSGGQRQAVAIARAVSWAKELVIMDEPTAALGPEQQEQVLALIDRVRSRGTAVLLVSHSLPQVLAIADRVAVLRRGELVALVPAADTNGDELVAYITGTRRQRESNDT
jgi:simple sugar transport system ATP-binding protein